MKSEKATIQFNKDTLRTVITLDDKSACAEFIEACLDYDDSEIIKEKFMHEGAGLMFTHAKPQLDEAKEQYNRKIQQRIDAANKRWEKERELKK